MSVIQKKVNVVSSVDNFLAVMVTIMADVKAGKAPAVVIADVVPSLVTALTGIGELKVDLTDRKDLETTVALKLAEIVNIFVP